MPVPAGAGPEAARNGGLSRVGLLNMVTLCARTIRDARPEATAGRLAPGAATWRSEDARTEPDIFPRAAEDIP
jgi:hypothetical protein